MIYRKSKFIILTIIILLSVLAVSFAVIPVFNGKEESSAATSRPIGSFAELDQFRIDVNNGDYTGDAYLTADINLKGSDNPGRNDDINFGSIGTNEHPFTGTFDGQGYKISGFNYVIHGDVDQSWTIGFFGAVNGGTIKNLWFDNYNVWIGSNGTYNSTDHTWSGFSGRPNVTDRVGSLVGYVPDGGNVTCSNILATNGSVTAVELASNAGQRAGGLIGLADGTVSLNNVEVLCNVSVVVRGRSGTRIVAGGIVGYCEPGSNFSNCYYSGTIINSTDDNSVVSDEALIGGIVGYLTDFPGNGVFNKCAANISGSYNVGSHYGNYYEQETTFYDNIYIGYQQENAICGGYIEVSRSEDMAGRTITTYRMREPSYNNCNTSPNTNGTNINVFKNIGWSISSDLANSNEWFINSSVNNGYPIQSVFLRLTIFTLESGEGGSATVSPSCGTDDDGNPQFYYSPIVSFGGTLTASKTYLGQNFLAEANEYYEFDRWVVNTDDSTITAIFSRSATSVYIEKTTPDDSITVEISISGDRSWSENNLRFYNNNIEYGTTFVYDEESHLLLISYVDGGIGIVSINILGSGADVYEVSGWQYRYGSNTDADLPASGIELNSDRLRLTPVFDLREYEAEFSVTSNGTNALGGILLDGEVEYELDETYTFVYGATLIRDNMSITITQPEGFEDRASLTLTASPGNGYSFTAWEYMYAGDSIWTTLGANTSIELTGDIYIRAYFAPIEYELPLSYIANSQGIYNETMVDFTIESPNQTFITDEDFMDSLTGEEDRYIDEQNKSFGAWVVGVDGNRLLQSGSPVDDYTVSVSTSYITIEAVDESGYWTLIRSVDNGNTFVSIEGYTYYVVLGLEQGSYGNLGEEIIILKWSNTYTVRVSNNDLNYWNESGIDRDEYIGVGSIGLDRDGEDILLEVKFNSRYAYPFMSSIMKNRALSFYKGSQYTTSDIMATSDMGSYYVYNYGYEITGWTLQFTYSGQYYYLYIRGNNWTVLRDVGGRYHYLNSSGKWIDAGLSSPVVPIGVLTNETMNDMSLYAETLDEMFAFDGTLSETEILMFPTWEATEIEVRTSNSNGETVLTTATYKQGYTFSNNVLSSLARTGESLIYFVENSSIGTDEDVIVTGTGETIWNYKELDHSQYDYEDGLYIIEVTARYVDNVYKVELIGARQQDGAYNLTDSDYTMSSNRAYTEDSYTYKSFYGYRDYPGGWIEEYGSELATLGATYNTAIANGTLEPLRKVYTDGSEMYIYLANDQRTGDLPIFRIDYYTLIYWINVNTMADGTRYVYTTREYDVDLHGSIEDGITHTGNEAGLWRYEDGGANKDIDGLEAKYFRKSYDVAVQTIAEGRQGEYGYVVVEIEDTVVPNTASADNEGGRYLFIYNNGMKIYEYSGNSLPRDVSTLDEVTGGYIRLYAGCDIEVIAYDQSRDVEAMKSGNYDMMIGYRLVEIVGGIFSGTDTDGDNYRRGMTAEEIESENWATGSRYVIEVEYEKISYDLVIEMSAGDTSQGNFTLNYPNGSQSGYMWRVELEGITVGETYQIRYNALAGYEYQEIAYSLILPNGYVVTLQTRAVWEADNTNQSYILVFDGTWLRENYYTVEVNGEEEGADPEYSVIDAGLGTLRVNTEEVEFRYNIMVYDSMRTGDDAWIDEIEVGTFKLSDVTLEVSSVFEALTSVGYGYIGESGEYAIISSYAYIVRNPMNRDRHYMSYSFPCRSIPTDEFEITTGLLGEMLNVSQYSIVGNTVEERTIYMTIEVRRIYEVIVEIEQGEHDTNSSERITRISNGTDNIVDVVLSASSTVDSEGVYTTRGRIYSYEGQTNRLSSIYDENRYSGVRYYYIDGDAREELDGNEFELVSDTLIRVEYIANSLAVEIVYELEGEVVGESELEGILTELEVTPREGLYEGSEIEIRESHERGYIVEIVVNGRVQTLENGETIYTVQDQDYDGGVIEIVVEITSEPRDEVSVELRIYNNEEILGNEDIGEVRIEVDGEVQDGSEATILEGQRVAFVIDLEAGYRYYGYRQNSGNVIQGGTGERIEVTDSFSIEEDAGRYIIYVEKERIDVVLRLGAEQKKNYMIESDNLRARKESNADNSEIRIVGVYVGNRITINRLEELEDEALRNYYYVIGDEAIEIEGNELELTSELIGRAGDELEIRVNSVNKYKLELEILNGEDELEIESNVELEENSRALYYEEGTIVELEIRTKTGDRYTIRASGDLEGEGDEIIGEIELDSDKEIEISIEPKRYEAEEDERVYTSVDGLDRGESEEAEGISGIEKEGQIYGETSIVRVNLRGEYLGESARLKRLEIEEESGRRIEIEVEGDEIKVTVDGEERPLTGDRLEIEGEIYRVRQTGERLELEYVTRGEMSVKIEYIVEKEISA